MPPSRNNTIKFTDLQAISSVNAGDIIPVVDTSVPTLVNKKINVQDFNRSLPVSQQMLQISTVSGNWNSNYSTTLANSAFWGTGGSYGSVYSANSAEYESTYTSVNANSANWNSAYSTVQASSAAWTGLTTYTTVNSLSENWNSGYSAYSSFNTLSSGTWLLKAGDQVTGTLTTTKTLTTQFTDLNEFVSKRYVDSITAGTQISGNFVPDLYYTKNDFSTGVPGVSTAGLTANIVNANLYTVQNDGFYRGIGGHYIQMATNNFFFVGNNIRTLSITENIAPGNGGIWMRSDRIVGWSTGGDPGNSGDLRLKRIGASSLALDSGGTANIPRFTVFGDISASRDMFSTSLQSSSNLLLSAVGNLSLNAGGSLSFSQSLPTSFAGLQATAPSSPSSSYFKILSSNNLTLFNINSAGRVAIRGRSSSVTEDQMNFPSRELELVGFTQPIMFRHSGNNTGFIVDEFGHGLYSDSGGCYIGSGGSGTRVYVVGGGINLGFQNTGMMAVNSIGKVRIGRGIIDSSTTTAVPAPSAHVQIITDSSYNSHVTDILVLSAGPGTPIPSSQFFTRFYTQADGTSILSVRKDGFTVLGVGGMGRVFLYEGSNLGIDLDPTNPTGNLGLASYMHFGWSSSIAANGTKDISLFRAGAGRLEQRASTTAQNYSIYNTYTDGNNYERLSLSATRIAYEYAGTGVSRDLTIETAGKLVLSASSLSFNQTLPFEYASLSARNLVVGPSDSSTGSVLRVPTSPGATGIPGIMAYANNAPSVPTVPDSRISIATFGGMGYQNTSSIYAPHILTNRIMASNASPVLDPNHWDDVSLKVAGKIGFTTQSLDASFKVRPLSATMEYDWSTNLISLSSRTAVTGFVFEPKSVQNQRSAIYYDTNDFLNISVGSGAGKTLQVRSMASNTNPAGDVFGSVSYSGWNMVNMSITNLSNYTASDSLRITQVNNQTAPYFRAVNSTGSTIFQINSASNVVVNNLLALGGITSSNAAIKGSGTTVVAKLGDDSDYAFLQGKLQTLNTAAAGTFTPDKYLILYDSSGTAYKVPVQAL
jgi:hypothetical protein